MPYSVQVPLPKGMHTLSAAICCQVLGYMFSKSSFSGCDSGARGEEKCRQQSVLLREAKTDEIFHSLTRQRKELHRGCEHRRRRWEPFSASPDWASPACELKLKVPLSQRYYWDCHFFPGLHKPDHSVWPGFSQDAEVKHILLKDTYCLPKDFKWQWAVPFSCILPQCLTNFAARKFCPVSEPHLILYSHWLF